jgi:hypothetical protein
VTIWPRLEFVATASASAEDPEPPPLVALLLEPDVATVDVPGEVDELQATAVARTRAAGPARSRTRRVGTTTCIGVLPFPRSAVIAAGEDVVPSPPSPRIKPRAGS